MKFKSFLAACVSAMLVATGVADGGTADCVRNGSFEAGTKYWQLTNGWSVGRGFGRNGSGGLVFESAAKTDKMVFAEQIVDVVVLDQVAEGVGDQDADAALVDLSAVVNVVVLHDDA